MKSYNKLYCIISTMALFCSTSQSWAQQNSAQANRFVDSLMKLMTIDERIGQLNLPTVGFDITGPVVSKDVDSKIEKGLVGGVFNTFTTNAVFKLQDRAIKAHRLHIPLLFGFDVIHGHRTIFPIPLALACTWNMDLVESSARVAAKEATNEGLNWTFSPMVDIVRDPRWGRVSESAGEDWYLGSQVAKAMVNGYQGSSLNNPSNLMACVKHFALYGAAEGGRDYNTVDMSLYKMANDYLPPYKAAVDAGVGSVMTSFNDINGVPATCNSFLLDTVLKKKWGFKGMIVTDFTAIAEMKFHGMGDDRTLAKRALEAGSDMDMVSELYLNHASNLLRDGKLSEEYINRSCKNILMAKYNLGLFHDPYRGLKNSQTNDINQLAEQKQEFLIQALKTAEESIVLLKNNGILPLKQAHLGQENGIQRIALIGPQIKRKRDLIGNWSGAGNFEDAVSLYEVTLAPYEKKLQDKMLRPINQFSFAQGCDLINNPELLAKLNPHDGRLVLDGRTEAQMIKEAVDVAKKADVVVLALGEAFGMSGEAASMTNIELQPQQKALFKAIKATGKPIVLLLMNGRPMVITDELAQADAVVECWFPGTMGGQAVKNVLFGAVNPSGKLTMSFPKNVGQIPVYYNSRTTGRPFDANQKYTSKYLDIDNNQPLLPFGYGLSYTQFTYSDLKVTQLDNGLVNVAVNITNSGKIAGKEVVQVYLSDVEASMTRPVKQLKRFKKIEIAAGETYTAQFQLTRDDFGFFNDKMQWVVEPGQFVIRAGGSSETPLKQDYWLK